MLAVRLIEQVGAYAGIAAIPGLAVLSALYFSQARDVRRLREWAGRAPERAAEQATGGRVAAQPVAQTPAAAAAAAKPATAAQPAPVGAPAAAAKPAVAVAAGAQGATAAGPAAPDKPATPGAAQPTTNGEGPPGAQADKPAALTPAAVASAAAAKTPAKAAGPPAVGGVKPGAPVARRPIPRVPSSQTSVLTPTTPPRDPWYRRLGARLPAARYIALIVAGALVLGGGAAYGISQLGKDDSGGSKSSTGNSSSSASSSKDTGTPSKQTDVKSTPAVNPADVTITVVNGTTVPNLARDTATKLSAMGFKIANKVTGTGSLAAAESIVEYKPGAENEARYVAAKLDISNRQPADPDAIAQAGPAQVILVIGANQAPGG